MKIPYSVRQRWERFLLTFHTPIFITMLLVFWSYHIALRGWFNYLFKPKMYVIRAGDIISDMEDDREGTPWWNKYECKAAHQVAMANDPDNIVTFTWRWHPFFLDNDILYINSPKYKARVINETIKVYRVD